MSNLIPIQSATIGGKVIQTVNARELHAFLGVGKAFAAWIQERIAQYGFADGADYTVFSDSGNNPSGGRPAKEYAISLDMAKELSMVERNDKGREARLYFIERDRQLAEVTKPAIPQTYAEALLEAGRLAMELEQAQQQIAVDAPKVEFVDRYVNASGSMGFREVCKILKANEREFKHWLFDTKVMYQLGKSMVPYSAHMDAGRFEIKTGNARHGDNDHAFKQARFTTKGIEWIAGEWGKHKARQVH